MVNSDLKTKGCLFGHLSDINPTLLEELKKFNVIKHPNNFTRVTHSYHKQVPSEATNTSTSDEANSVKELHLNGNKDGKLWQTFFTWNTDDDSVNKLKTDLMGTMEYLFLEIFKYAYGGLYLNDIQPIGHNTVNLTHFNKDCFINGHADGGGRQMLCNILIYLNEDWQEGYGGELVIQEKYEQPPIFGNFAVIDFKDVNPMHAVTPIKSDNFHRYTILTGILFKENYFNSIN